MVRARAFHRELLPCSLGPGVPMLRQGMLTLSMILSARVEGQLISWAQTAASLELTNEATSCGLTSVSFMLEPSRKTVIRREAGASSTKTVAHELFVTLSTPTPMNRTYDTSSSRFDRLPFLNTCTHRYSCRILAGGLQDLANVCQMCDHSSYYLFLSSTYDSNGCCFFLKEQNPRENINICCQRCNTVETAGWNHFWTPCQFTLFCYRVCTVICMFFFVEHLLPSAWCLVRLG